MVDVTGIRTRLQTKVFTSLGSTITVYGVSSSVVNDYGDITITYDAGTSEKGVPYNLLGQKTYEPFGELKSNEIDIVLRYDSVITLNSKVLYNSKNYLVLNVEDFVLKDLSVAKVARLSEII